VIEPEEVKENPEGFRCIGEEVTEMLDYRPAKFFRHQIIRRKFARRQESELAPIIAPFPESLQQRCIAGPGLLAQMIVSKFCDHIPLYRQEQIYWNRYQVWLPRQSLVRWVQLASEWLKPIYREIKDQMMSGLYIQVDETPIKYLDPGNGKTAQGYFWVAYRRVKTCSLSGTRLGRRSVCKNSFRLALTVRSNVMATALTTTLPLLRSRPTRPRGESQGSRR
jgi:transposase